MADLSRHLLERAADTAPEVRAHGLHHSLAAQRLQELHEDSDVVRGRLLRLTEQSLSLRRVRGTADGPEGRPEGAGVEADVLGGQTQLSPRESEAELRQDAC